MDSEGDPARASYLSRALASEWIPPGLFFIVLGAAALWVSRDYPLGDLNRMGPGYFPRMLSVGMICLGVLIVRQGLPGLAGGRGCVPGLTAASGSFRCRSPCSGFPSSRSVSLSHWR